jgi:hypothetical protein
MYAIWPPFFLKTVSLYVPQAGLDPALLPKLDSNLWSSCLSLPSAEIAGVNLTFRNFGENFESSFKVRIVST